MAATYKVLGQVQPTFGNLTSLYTVGAGKTAVISTITVCNQSSSATATFRISVAVAGAADATSQYVAYDAFLDYNETKAYTLGITLGSTDVIRVYGSTSNLSFHAYGSEIV
jgi:hypothetical protein